MCENSKQKTRDCAFSINYSDYRNIFSDKRNRTPAENDGCAVILPAHLLADECRKLVGSLLVGHSRGVPVYGIAVLL